MWVLVPVILMLTLTVAMEFLASATENIWVKGIVVSAFGIVGLFLIVMAVRWIAYRLQIIPPEITVWRPVAIGLAVGLLLSITCGLLFRLLHGEPTTATLGAAIEPANFLRSMGPALIEEASMRAGVVHLLNGLNGPWARLAPGRCGTCSVRTNFLCISIETGFSIASAMPLLIWTDAF